MKTICYSRNLNIPTIVMGIIIVSMAAMFTTRIIMNPTMTKVDEQQSGSTKAETKRLATVISISTTTGIFLLKST